MSQNCKNTLVSTLAPNAILVATERPQIIDLKQHKFIILHFWTSEVQN